MFNDNPNHAEIMRLRAVASEYEETIHRLAAMVDEFDNLNENSSLMDQADLLDAIVSELREIIS